MSKAKFHGIGEAIYDVVFKESNNGLVFLKGCGGGSIGNFLANCVSEGYPGTFHGAQGGSLHGELAMSDLEYFGVSIGQSQSSKANDSRIIFQTIKGKTADDLFSTSKHKFSLRCPICRVKPKESALPKLEPSFFISLQNFTKSDILFFDKITADRTKLSRKHIKDGGLSLLDLGHIGALRYRKPEELVWQLNSFNVIHTSESIVQSLAKRVGSSGDDSLFRHLLDHLLLISDGANGLRVVRIKDGEVKTTLSQPSPNLEEIVDDAGAGDTLFSVFVCKLLDQTKGSPRSILRFGAARWKPALETALEKVVSVISCEGARCHLPGGDSFDSRRGFLLERRGQHVIDSQAKDNSGVCIYCHRKEDSLRHTEESKGAAQNVLLYSKNVDELRREMQKGFSSNSEEAAKKSLPASGSCLVVGTGGSYPVAQFLAEVINSSSDSLAVPMRPLEFIRLRKRVDRMIVITYSGKTEDCRVVIDKARDIGIGSIHLVSRSHQPLLKSLLRPKCGDTVVSYHETGKKEGGFVSIKGTVIPCALYLKALFNDNEQFSDVLVAVGKHFSRQDGDNFAHRVTTFFKKNLKKIRNTGIVEAFGSAGCLPAMSDLESKFVEGGLNIVRLHESKDFSHGRFMSFRGEENEQKLAIVFSVSRMSSYEETLVRSLRNRNIPVLEVVSETDGLYGSFELLFLVQYIVKILGDVLKKDISKPSNIPKWGLQLYNWPNIV